MKLRLLMALASAVLFLAPRTAGALDTEGQQGVGMSSRALMQNANESAQATTDMQYGESAQGAMPGDEAARKVSYGGVAAGQSEAGGPQNRSCSSVGPQCKVYFGQ